MTKNRKGVWHGTKFFYRFTICPYDKVCNPKNSDNQYYSPGILRLFVFEFKTKQWSKICFNYPIDKFSFVLDFDSEGVLNILSTAGFPEYSSSLCRIPLG